LSNSSKGALKRWHPGTPLLAAAALVGVVCAVPASASTALRAAGSTGPTFISNCPGRNAEVENAVSGEDVYVEWIGCHGIGFARSTNGGLTYQRAVELPGSGPSECGSKGCLSYSWDPSIAVSTTGTIYAAFMHGGGGDGLPTSPVVDVSTNHGVSFVHSYVLPQPGGARMFGDRDFIAVGAHGELFVTWDYAPSAAQVKFQCPPSGSCSYSHGDLNIVVQHSTNGGQTWSKIMPISPGYPDSGADTAPIVAQPNGTLDVLFQRMPTNRSTLALGPGIEWFTRSTNDGVTWSKPIEIGASAGKISTLTWWIDGDLSTDSAGNLYATWDTQRASVDTGWLSISRDGGKVWSKPIDVVSSGAEELTESAGVGKGMVDVAWQTPGPDGYATFVRPYSLAKGWLTSAPVQVSMQYGSSTVWPGDTFGIEAMPTRAVEPFGMPIAMTWGSDVSPSPFSEMYSATFDPSSPGFAAGSVTGAAGSAVVNVSWSKPSSGASPITGYAVYYAHPDGSGRTKVCSTNPSTFACTNVTLPRDHDLELLVEADNRFGASTAVALGPGPNGDWWWLWDELSPGDTIQPGECMWSFSRAYSFCMSYGGDLTEVQESDATTLWSLSSKIGAGALVPGAFATYQSDGNFVVYPPGGGTAIWSTGTFTSAGGHFSIQDDGNIVIYNSSSVAVCARFGTAPCPLN
jgi:hypothetical protein